MNKPLVHHTIEGNSSYNIDNGIGLSWRNQTVQELLEWAAIYESSSKHTSNLLFGAALLKENAINNGINLEDK